MTCWIEDEFHLEEHAHPPTFPKERRPCNMFCEDGVHATVVFITGRLTPESAPGHAVGQFVQHHQLAVVKAVPALEVEPEMYPNRKHHGAPAEPGEGLTAWLIYFKARGRQLRDEYPEHEERKVPITDEGG